LVTSWEPTPVFLAPGALAPIVDDINPDDQGDVQLLNAIQAGLVALNKVQPGKDKSGESLPPPRKAIVVLSDGMNQLMDRKTFRRVGDLLRQSGVPLFPIAFSPRDDRGPLLNLGELAKRSLGTFRWAQKDTDLKEQFQNLSEELKKNHVLHFAAKKLSLDDLRTSQFALQCGDLKSNPIMQPGVPPPKPSTWWKWLLGILLSLVGLWGAAQGDAVCLKAKGAAAGPAGSANAGEWTGSRTAGGPDAATWLCDDEGQSTDWSDADRHRRPGRSEAQHRAHRDHWPLRRWDHQLAGPDRSQPRPQPLRDPARAKRLLPYRLRSSVGLLHQRAAHHRQSSGERWRSAPTR
jgi:hypothetical protein